jgi:hypothetical protein
VSLDLVVVPNELDGDEAGVLALYYEEAEGDDFAAERLRAFGEKVAESLERDGRWPWSGPVEIEGSFAVLHPAYEWWEDVIAVLPRIASEHGLVVYDPQSSDFIQTEFDPERTWDMLVIHARAYPRAARPDDVNGLPLWTMRARLDGEIECKELIDSFLCAVQTGFADPPWTIRRSESAVLFAIRVSEWKAVVGSLMALAQEHGLAAKFPQGSPVA